MGIGSVCKVLGLFSFAFSMHVYPVCVVHVLYELCCVLYECKYTLTYVLFMRAGNVHVLVLKRL